MHSRHFFYFRYDYKPTIMQATSTGLCMQYRKPLVKLWLKTYSMQISDVIAEQSKDSNQ